MRQRVKHQIVVLQVPVEEDMLHDPPAHWNWTMLADTVRKVTVLAAGPITERLEE